MRELLTDYFEKRGTFTGIFRKFSHKTGYQGTVERTVLLVHICDSEGKSLCDHLWFNYTAGFQALGEELTEGVKVQFDARCAEYIKGYRGYNEEKRQEHPIEYDYKLSYPTKICIYGKPVPKRQVRDKTKMQEEPTEKQKNFISLICETLGIPLVICKTRESASNWLYDHIEKFENKRQKIRKELRKANKTKESS